MTNRGHRSLFTSLFEEDHIQTQIPFLPAEKKGRSEHLNAKRNELLLCRYYYYVKILDKNYPFTLAKLEEEMHITQRRIVDLIQQDRQLLSRLNATKPELNYFREKYPWLVWDIRKLQ